MRTRVIALLIASLLTPLFAHASAADSRANSSETFQIISYAELMQLPRAEREQYIQGVRETLIELSSGKGRLSDRNAQTREQTKDKTRANLKAWLELLDRTMSEVRADESDDEPAMTEDPYVKQRKTLDVFGQPIKYQPKPLKLKPRPEDVAVKAAPIEAASEELKTKSMKGLEPVEPVQSVQMSVDPTLPKDIFGKPTTYRPKPLKLDPLPPTAAAGDEAESPEAVDGVKSMNRTTPAAIASESRAPAQTAKPEVDSNPAVKKEKPVNLSPRLSCAPKPEICETGKRLVVPPGQPCIFAGMMSALDSQNQKCQAVTSYKIGDFELKCSAGQTMCNPLLFGTVSESRPICIGRGQDATVQCSKLSSAREAEKFLNRSLNGLQEQWDKLRSDMASVCARGSNSAKFHCTECNVLRQRIFDLHARLLKDPCGARSSTEGAGYEAIKRRIQNGGNRGSGIQK